jgi:hypothetical protein
MSSLPRLIRIVLKKNFNLRVTGRFVVVFVVVVAFFQNNKNNYGVTSRQSLCHMEFSRSILGRRK